MTLSRQKIAGAALVLAVTLAMVGSLAVVGAAQGTSADLSIDELRQRGISIEGAPDSVRTLGETSTLAVKHYPTQPFSSKEWYYLGQQDPVRADELELQSVRLGGSDEKDYLVRLAYWRPDTKTVRGENGTTTNRVASIQSVESKRLSLGSNYDTATIDLQSVYDEPHVVTMCVQEPADENCLETGDGPRYVFNHLSNPGSQSAGIQSEADLWGWTAKNLLLPTLGLTGVVAAVVPVSMRWTGDGPNKGLGFWIFALIGLAFASLVAAYHVTQSLLISAPWVVSVLIAGIVGIVFLEQYESGLEEIILFRMITQETEAPNGTLAKTASRAEWTKQKFVKLPDGRLAAIPRGIRPWIARLFGGATIVENAEDIKSELDLFESDADKLLFIDSDAEDLISLKPEHLELRPKVKDPPRWEEIDDETSRSIDWGSIMSMLLVAGGAASITFLIAPPAVALVVGIAAFIVHNTESVEGTAHIEPAPGNTEKAYATTMYLDKQLDQYKTFEAALKRILDEQNSKEKFLDWLEDLDTENVVAAANDKDTEDFEPFETDAIAEKSVASGGE